MLWRRAAPSPVVPCTTPVPDADRLRLMALQASWARGRWVARRRVALRWLLWIGTRYLMPALAVSGVAAWLWLGVPEAATTTSPSAIARPDAAAMDRETMGGPTHNPEGDMIDSPAILKFETRWAAATPALPAAVGAIATSTEPDPHPLLKPENWLHSKEP